jgi:hypothetical protein
MMPPVDFKGIKAVALRSARSAMGAPATGGQKTDRIRPTQGCYVMSNGLTTIASQLGKLLPRLGSNHDGEVVAAAAAYKFKEKFGFWPPCSQPAPPQRSSPEVLSRVRSRNIAWAKAKGRAA